MSEPEPIKKERIILLGGSFNPAHEGHIHISLNSMEALNARRILWILSPHNPLKDKDDIEDYNIRKEHALILTEGLPIELSEIEQSYNLQHSIDTIKLLKSKYNNKEFIWLMGSDNLVNFHKWKSWREIANQLPIAIYKREPYHEICEKVPAFEYLKPYIKTAEYAKNNPISAPCYIKLDLETHEQSATFLRKTLGSKAFLKHNKD